MAAFLDILWSDLTVTQNVRPTNDGVVPIGLCIAATGFFGENEPARFMSLKFMSINNPEIGTGENDHYDGGLSIIWGNNNVNINNLNIILPYNGSYGNYGYVQVDYYDSSEEHSIIPNILDENDEWNISELGTVNSYASTDINGKYNTTILLSTATSQSTWQTDSTITNNSGANYAPAACCCARYHTLGTQAGDWYLGGCGEMIMVILQKTAIDIKLSQISSVYPSHTITSIGNRSFWTSTPGTTNEYAWDIVSSNGTIHGTVSRTYGRTVLALIREDDLVYETIYETTEHIKVNNHWEEILAVYKKINNIWTLQTDFTSSISNAAIYFYNSAQIDISVTFEISGPNTYTGKSFIVSALYNNQTVIPTWSITSGNAYASINQNGKVTIEEGADNNSITIQALFNGLSDTKTITVSYDNQLNIECGDTITGTSGNAIARYNSTIVTPTWTITSGSEYATIDSSGNITIIDSGNITIQATYNNYIVTKNISVVYDAGTTTETIVDEEGNVTTETTTTTVDSQTGETTTTTTSITTNDDGSSSTTETEVVENQDGSSSTTSTTTNSDGSSSETSITVSAPDPETGAITTESSETITNSDGTSSETESTLVENEDGSSQSSSTTTNYDEYGDTTGSTENESTHNADGSSHSTTTNYNANGDPTDKVNNEIDTSGNSSTQDIEYDTNGDPTITGYSIDTSNNEDGYKDFNADGVNTEFYGFDTTRGFILDFHFIIDTANQPSAQDQSHHNILTMKRATPEPWFGFQIRQTGTNKYVQLGTQFGKNTNPPSKDGNNTNTTINPAAANKVNGSATVLEYDLTITYNPTASANKFVCVEHLSNTTIYTANKIFPDIEALRYLTICIGYAQDDHGDPYRYSNINVLNFNVTKINNINS